MNSSARPATPTVPTTALTVPAPTTAQHPAAGRPSPAPHAASAQPHDEDEATAQAKRDFYAWCAGCEGYGSIF